MRRSRAELAAHLMRAARGAGLPLALAEDLYAAAGFLTVKDMAWVASDVAGGGAELERLSSSLDRIQCGGQDAALPEVAEALAAGRGWRLKDGRCLGEPERPEPGAVEVADDVWSVLDTFAARTYVPDSDLSRAKGAGAGAIDND